MKSATRRIVCATDFSENARRAADVAAALARRLDARLVLVHVADEVHAFEEGTKELAAALREAKARLHTEAERVRRGAARVEEVLLQGRWAGLAVGDFLAESRPWLAVVSSVSKTTFDRWTLGSVSEHLAQHAPVPTLVVRAPERLLAWAQQERPLCVMAAVDFSVSAEAALAWVRDIQNVGPCAVTVAHINWPPDARPRPRGERLSLTSNPPRVTRELLRSLRRKVGNWVEGVVEVRLEPNWGRPDAALVRLAVESDADVIVVGTHQRHGVKRIGHGSVSRGVLRHAPMNVAGVPVTDAIAHGIGRHPRVQRVLVATDLSPAGDQAVAWAYATVAAGGVVKLVHVVAPWLPASPLVPRYELKPGTRVAQRAQARKAREHLAGLIPADAVVRGVESDVEVIEDGDPANGINLAARSFGPDVIVLSNGDRPALAKALLGSVVQDVIAGNAAPTLLVKPQEP